MKKLSRVACSLAAVGSVSGFTWTYFGQRDRVEFYAGHTHWEHGTTDGAPQHSGGLDALGRHTPLCPTAATESAWR